MVERSCWNFALMICISIIISGCMKTEINDDQPDQGLTETEDNDLDNDESDNGFDDTLEEDNNDEEIGDDVQEKEQEGPRIKKFYHNVSGYCYNPEYPEYGPSSDIRIFNWEELTGDRISKQLFINYTLDAEDDHYGSFSEDDTGDVFILTDVLYNKSTGEEEYRGGIATFPGVCSADTQIHLQNITGGVGLLPTFQFEINITNCGEYPVYWKLGIVSEPDPGNAWRLLIEYVYIPEE